jgi:hypothetical protein
MYNGVGLTTVRGTATNGYVQRNKAFQRPKEKVLSFPPVVWRTSRPLISRADRSEQHGLNKERWGA